MDLKRLHMYYSGQGPFRAIMYRYSASYKDVGFQTEVEFIGNDDTFFKKLKQLSDFYVNNQAVSYILFNDTKVIDYDAPGNIAAKFGKSNLPEITELVKNKFITYLEEDLRRKSTFFQNEELARSQMALTPEEFKTMIGGSKMYHGRRYKVHTGKRGGKYILVGTEKKKVYV